MIELKKKIEKVKKEFKGAEITDFSYTLKNVDLPLKQIQNLLKNLKNLTLEEITMELFYVTKKLKAVPMLIHKSKCPHRKKFIKNVRNVNSGPGKFPVKCATRLLKVLKYIASMNKELGLTGYDNSKLLILKEAYATKGSNIKSAFYRAFGRMSLKRKQKVHLTLKVARVKVL